MSELVSDRRETFKLGFESDFREWCEDRSNGSFEKRGRFHMECDLNHSTVGVKRRNHLPLDVFGYASTPEGSITVTEVDEYDERGTKFSLEGYLEEMSIGPDGQIRVNFREDRPSQHERSQLRDREIRRSDEVSDIFTH